MAPDKRQFFSLGLQDWWPKHIVFMFGSKETYFCVLTFTSTYSTFCYSSLINEEVITLFQLHPAWLGFYSLNVAWKQFSNIYVQSTRSQG